MNQQIETTEFLYALRSVRRAKNVLLLLVLLALLAQLAGSSLVTFTDLIIAQPTETPSSASASQPAADEADRAGAPDVETPADETPATQPADAKPAESDETDSAEGFPWKIVAGWTLPAAKAIAFAATVLTALSLLLGVLLVLAGRAGGVSGIIGAFFWSILLIALVTPWQQVLNSTLLAGALSNFGDLAAWLDKMRSEGRLMTTIYFYGRFFGAPSLALLVWIVVHAKFRSGCRRAMASTQQPPAI